MKKITFEKALEKLEEIVGDLEAGELSLDESLKKYEEGIKMARICQGYLGTAKSKVELLMKGADGTFKKEDFEGNDE